MKYLFFLSAVFYTTVLFQTELSFAEIYRWVDESGVTHFPDSKPAGNGQREVETFDPSGAGDFSVVPIKHSGRSGTTGDRNGVTGRKVIGFSEGR